MCLRRKKIQNFSFFRKFFCQQKIALDTFLRFFCGLFVYLSNFDRHLRSTHAWKQEFQIELILWCFVSFFFHSSLYHKTADDNVMQTKNLLSMRIPLSSPFPSFIRSSFSATGIMLNDGVKRVIKGLKFIVLIAFILVQKHFHSWITKCYWTFHSSCSSFPPPTTLSAVGVKKVGKKWKFISRFCSVNFSPIFVFPFRSVKKLLFLSHSLYNEKWKWFFSVC